MKRNIILILLVLSATATFAQMGKYRSDLAVGFVGGVRMNTISFKPHVEHTWHVGPEVGVSVRYTCEKLINMICALQTEVTFAQLGWKEPTYEDGYAYTRTMNYMRIPFLAHLGFGREEKGFKGFLLAGPELGFALGESSKLSGPNPTEGIAFTTETAQRTLPYDNSFDYGITAGGGLEYSHPKIGHFTLDARYYFALSSVFDDSKKGTFTRSANQSIVVKLTYFYDVIKTRNRAK